MDDEGSQPQSLQSDITICYNLLSTILQSKNTSSLKFHEQKLLQLSKKKQFIHILLAVLTLPQANDNIIKMAIQYVKIFLRTSLIYQEIKTVIGSIRVVIDYIGKSSIKLSYKSDLIQKLVFMFSKTRFRSLKIQCQNKLQQLLSNTITGSSSQSTSMQQLRQRPSIQLNTSQINIQFIALFSRLVIDSIDREYANYSNYLTRNFKLLIPIVVGFAGNLNQSAQKADDKQIQHHVEVFIIFIDLLHSWISKMKLAGLSISQIINIPQLPLIITSSLALSPQKNTFPYPLFYLQFPQPSTQSCLGTKIHNLKYETLRLLNQCIKNTFFNCYNNNRIKDGVQMSMDTQQVCENLNSVYLYGVCEEYLRMFVKSVGEMLDRCCWWQFGSLKLVEIVVEVAVFITSIIKAKTMYSVFVQLKQNIIFKICLKLLNLSAPQLTNYTDQPQQFINSLYHTIQKPELTSTSSDKKQNYSSTSASTSAISISKAMQQLQKQQKQKQKQQQQQEQQFNYLKSTIMEMFTSYCFFVDGVMSQLVQMGLMVLAREQGSKDEGYVCMIMLAGLWRNIYSHRNCQFLIAKYLISKVGNFNFTHINTTQTNIKYTLLLLTLQTYLPQLQSQTQNFLPSTLLLSTNILCSATCDETHKLIACELIKTVFIINQQNKQKNKNKDNKEFDIICDADIANMLNVLCECLEPSHVNARLVSCLNKVVGEALGVLGSRGINKSRDQANVLEFNDGILEIQTNQMEQENKKNVQNANYEEYVQPMNKIIDKTLMLILTLSTQSISGNDKTILNNLIDLLFKISSNITRFPPIVSYIRDKISPLVPTFLKQDNPMFQTLPQILTQLIKCSKQISNTQINAFRFIFNAFSTGPRKLSLSQSSFSFLQHLLMYGSQTIVQSESSKQFISAIITMSITSIRQESVDQILVRGQGEMVQGVLIMQTAIVSLARGFTKGLWVRMVDCLIEKMGYKGGIRYDFMKAEIFINLGLIVGLAHGFIDANKLAYIVEQLSKCHYYFTYPNTTKLAIIALTQLLPILISHPTLKSYTQPILSCTLTMIKLTQQKKDKSLFDQQLDSEEQEYTKIKQKCLNPLNKIDQFQLFNAQIIKIRNMYSEDMKNIQQQLMPILKRVLGCVGGVRRVAGDVRVIYQIKR